MEEYQKRKLEWYKSLPAPHRKAVVRSKRKPGYLNSFTLYVQLSLCAFATYGPFLSILRFVKEQYLISSTSTTSVSDRMKELAEKYGALSDAEKDVWHLDFTSYLNFLITII